MASSNGPKRGRRRRSTQGLAVDGAAGGRRRLKRPWSGVRGPRHTGRRQNACWPARACRSIPPARPGAAACGCRRESARRFSAASAGPQTCAHEQGLGILVVADLDWLAARSHGPGRSALEQEDAQLAVVGRGAHFRSTSAASASSTFACCSSSFAVIVFLKIVQSWGLRVTEKLFMLGRNPDGERDARVPSGGRYARVTSLRSRSVFAMALSPAS